MLGACCKGDLYRRSCCAKSLSLFEAVVVLFGSMKIAELCVTCLVGCRKKIHALAFYFSFKQEKE